MRWLVSVIGFVLAVLGVYWSIQPLPNFEPLFLGGVTFLLGLVLAISGYVWHRNSRQQTVTIALGEEAEHEIEVIDKLQLAVQKHENPDRHVPKSRQKQVKREVFAQLPKETLKFRKPRKR